MAGSRWILLVEDNPDDVELARMAFAEGRLFDRLEVARDGVEALEHLFGTAPDGRPRPLPRLVFLDLKLPKLDGLQILERVRADPRTRLLPIVVLTSSDEERDIVRAYSLGANSYIRKPIDFGDFLAAIRDLHRYWLGLNTPPPLGDP
jgi:two-component system, response regulator